MIIRGLEDENAIVGWIESRSGLHSFSVSLITDVGSKYGQVDINSLVVDKELNDILRPLTSKSWFREKLERFRTAKALAVGIQNYVNDLTADQQTQAQLNWVESSLPQLLMKHLDGVGWDRVMKVNEDLTVIQLSSIDSADRIHKFDILINPGYPLISPTVQATLPIQIDIPWTQSSDLQLIVTIVDREIRRFGNLFKELEEIDSKTWVLEPSQPNFSTSYRRLALERSCSIVFDIDIDNPSNVCNINFFGPINRVNYFRLSVNRNLHLWSKDRRVKENLELMLGFVLPSKNIDGNNVNDNLCEECGICYTYSISISDQNNSLKNNYSNSNSNSNPNSISNTGNLKNDMSMKNNGNKYSNTFCKVADTAVSVPDQACGNSRCSKIYHFSCLVDWFHSLPSSKTSFGTLFGSCPYCQEAISVRIQK